jgi:energy-coupling factor transporter transmembrane protein EcfT
LFFIAIPVVFLLIDQVNFFQNYINDGGLINDLKSLPYKQQEGIQKYIRTEILLLGTAAIVSGILFGIRMLVSVFPLQKFKYGIMVCKPVFYI